MAEPVSTTEKGKKGLPLAVLAFPPVTQALPGSVPQSLSRMTLIPWEKMSLWVVCCRHVRIRLDTSPFKISLVKPVN